MATKITGPEHDPFDLLGLAVLNTAWWTIIGIGVTAWWALLFPMISIPIGLTVAAGLFLGWLWAIVVVAVFGAGMVLWRAKHPETFERWITSRARTRFLTWFRYRRRWSLLLEACSLTITRDDKTLVPRLLSVRIGTSVDVVRVRMLNGHCPADWTNRVEHLAHAFGALECRATIAAPAVVELAFRLDDSLAHPIDLPRIDGGRWMKDAA